MKSADILRIYQDNVGNCLINCMCMSLILSLINSKRS
jgi:hypothetical protein